MRNPTKLLLAFGLLGILMTGAGCPGKPKYPACEGDKDCKAGEKCVNKRCVQCAADADCGPGKQCVNGGCEPIPGWCSADGDCPKGQVCKDNRCVACTADAECGPGGRCRDGRCLRKGQCDTDEDCPEDQDCVNGVCTSPVGDGGAAGLPKCRLEPVYFGFDERTIAETAKPTLQKNAECLSSTPRRVAVIGMTDPRGTDEYNVALSDARARAVADYLARLGIDPARLRIVPKGESEATGTDEATWAKDRRVEFAWE